MGADDNAADTKRQTILIGFNGINSGCGIIALAIAEILMAEGYDLVLLGSGNAGQMVQRMIKKQALPITFVEILGYDEIYVKNTVSEYYCVLDYLKKQWLWCTRPESLKRIVDNLLGKHDVCCYVSVYEALGSSLARYRGVPTAERGQEGLYCRGGGIAAPMEEHAPV